MLRRTKELDVYAKTLIDLYLQTQQKVEILDSLGSQDIIERLPNSYGANAFDALVNTLIEDIIRSTWAFALDKADKTPSVANIWSMASQPSTLAALRKHFPVMKATTPAPGPVSLEVAKLRLQQFDDAVIRLQQSVPAATTGSMAGEFVRARNKGVAHHEMQRLAESPPRRFDLRTTEISWEGLREYVESFLPVVKDLTLIITGIDYQLAEVHEHHRINAEDFWLRIMGIGQIQPK